MSSVQVSLVREFRTLNEKLDKLFSRSVGTKLTDYKIETITESDASDNLTISYMCSATYCGVYKFTGMLQLLEGENSIKEITSSVIADKVKLINGKLVYNDRTEFYISSFGAPPNTSSFLAYFSCDSSIMGENVPQLVVSVGKVMFSDNFTNYNFTAYTYNAETDTVSAGETVVTPTNDLFAVYITPSNPPENSGIHFYVSAVPTNLCTPDSEITCYRFTAKS